MSDDSNDSVSESDPGDHSPDSGQPVQGHGYDAAFFITAFLVAIGFVALLYYFI